MTPHEREQVRTHVLAEIADVLRWMHLSIVLLAGRGAWGLPCVPLAWLVARMTPVWLGWRSPHFTPDEAQVGLIGLPLVVLGILLGARVIAGEVEQRRIEVAYSVPRAAARTCAAKLAGASVLITGSAVLLGIVTHLWFTPCSVYTIYGALQGALFYTMLSMAAAVLLHSEVAGAMVATAMLGLNGLITGFGSAQLRLSPLWNPTGIEAAQSDVLAWTIQNRTLVLLVSATLLWVAFAAANERERVLRGVS